MVFTANPLSLSVPEPAFESWLRDAGYLEILDERTTTIAALEPSSSDATNKTKTTTINIFATLLSLFTINPFAKLTADDFSGETPAWTVGFIGLSHSYSWPSEPSQAKMRVHENVKRYARNYAFLALIFFACSLYQMPIVLFGLISSLAVWELFRFGTDRWVPESCPTFRHVLVRIVQFATAYILYRCNIGMALLFALGVSYTVMILHASFRKLTPSKQPVQADQHRFKQNKYRS